MKRTQAILYGESWLEDENLDAEDRAFIEEALQALEQEPCEDCISRQAVLDLAKKGVLISNGNYESVCKAINEIPSVNPIKTGHWIKKDGYSDCSECGSHIVTEWDYCPKCGAKMIEPQERSGEE